jgi:hypothetical protein
LLKKDNPEAVVEIVTLDVVEIQDAAVVETEVDHMEEEAKVDLLAEIVMDVNQVEVVQVVDQVVLAEVKNLVEEDQDHHQEADQEDLDREIKTR